MASAMSTSFMYVLVVPIDCKWARVSLIVPTILGSRAPGKVLIYVILFIPRDLSLAWPDRFFSFIFRQEKRAWNSSQAPLVFTLPTGMGSINKGNVICFQLVAAGAYYNKRIIIYGEWSVEMEVKAAVEFSV